MKSLWSQMDSCPKHQGVPDELTYVIGLILRDRPKLTNEELVQLLDKAGIPAPEALRS